MALIIRHCDRRAYVLAALDGMAMLGRRCLLVEMCLVAPRWRRRRALREQKGGRCFGFLAWVALNLLFRLRDPPG
jgi:hypothetical protein